MLLFEGEPVIFGLFSVAVFTLLIGGCVWGSSEAGGNTAGEAIGIVVFCVGCLAAALFIMAFVYKKLRSKRLMKEKKENLLRLQQQLNKQEYDNPAMKTSDEIDRVATNGKIPHLTTPN